MANISIEDRYLNSALINLGEALTELGNIRQRGGTPGSDCANVKLALLRATASLNGEPFTPPENNKNT